jgi:Cdc6-like AAA superfamily ATPase
MNSVNSIIPAKNSWKNSPLELRHQWFRNAFIKHPKVSAALKAIAMKIERCILTGQGDGIFILGEPGSGKTRLIRYICESYEIPPEKQTSEVTIRPVVTVKIPDTCTRKQVMVEILDGLGADTKGSFHDLMKRAITLFRACSVRLVLIDDLQDIPARRSLRGVHDIAICIRDLIDNTNALFVLCGNKDALVVLDSDLQLRKRIPFRLSLHYFNLNKEIHKKEFVKLLDEMEKWLPLCEKSCITDSIVMEQIYLASGGIFQYIIKILDHAWPIALENKREHIISLDLKNAFELIFGEISNEVNPFSTSGVLRLLNQKGEPFHGWI